MSLFGAMTRQGPDRLISSARIVGMIYLRRKTPQLDHSSTPYQGRNQEVQFHKIRNFDRLLSNSIQYVGLNLSV